MTPSSSPCGGRRALLPWLACLAALALPPAEAASREKRDLELDASPGVSADWVLGRGRPEALLPLPANLTGQPEPAWQQAIQQAGNCPQGAGTSAPGGARAPDGQPPAPTRPPADTRGQGGGQATGGAGGQDPNRYTCPRVVLGNTASLQVTAFRMVLQRTHQLAMSLESADPALAWPVRSLLRTWAEHLERWRLRTADADFTRQLDAQGRALVSLHDSLSHIATLQRAGAPLPGHASRATGEALRSMQQLARQGFAPDSLSALATAASRLLAGVQTADVPPANPGARPHAAFERNRVWIGLVGDYINQLPPNLLADAQRIQARLVNRLSSAGEQSTPVLAQLARTLALAVRATRLAADLGLEGPNGTAGMQQRMLSALERDFREGRERYDAALALFARIMSGVAATDLRDNTAQLADTLARALDQSAARGGPVPALAPLNSPAHLQQLILDVGPEGAIELVRGIVDLSEQLRFGIQHAGHFSPPRPTIAPVQRYLAARLQGRWLQISPGNTAQTYLQARDTLYTALYPLERDLLGIVQRDLDRMRVRLQDYGNRHILRRQLDEVMTPSLRLMQNNLSLRDYGPILVMSTNIGLHEGRLSYIDERFIAMFRTHLDRLDYSRLPRPGASLLDGLQNGLNSWMIYVPVRYEPEPDPAPNGRQRPRHDEL